ncbi:MAG: sulfur carrier protein ThiS [Flavobacteriales bacterium]
MKITVNQEQKDVSENLNLFQLLNELNIQQRQGIAIAVGMQIIPQQQWETTILEENQSINIITASQGG